MRNRMWTMAVACATALGGLSWATAADQTGSNSQGGAVVREERTTTRTETTNPGVDRSTTRNNRDLLPNRDEKNRETVQNAVKAPHAALRSTDIIGTQVRNSQGEKLGQIENLVLDLNSGQIRYAALSFGGFLGIGDKLFAVPWKSLEMRVESDRDNNRDGHRFFVLNVDKERLRTAPGFSKDNWPNMANPQWASDVDKFYSERAAQRTEGETRSR